jgi:hypothetical protein
MEFQFSGILGFTDSANSANSANFGDRITLQNLPHFLPLFCPHKGFQTHHIYNINNLSFNFLNYFFGFFGVVILLVGKDIVFIIEL